VPADRAYPRRLQPKRWCRNGAIPDALFQTKAEIALNHTLAYRRKVVLSCGGDFGSSSSIGTGGTTTYWRTHFRSGYGVTALQFDMLLGPSGGGAGTGVSPRIEIDVTDPSGPTTQTVRIDYSANSAVDEPRSIGYHERKIPIDPLTTYEVAVRGIDFGRPISVTAYEYADPEVDASRLWFAELAPTVEQPIYDKVREYFARGMSEVWLENGPMLLQWPGNGAGTAQQNTGTTWRNMLDLSSTTVGSSTPGWNFAAQSSGGHELENLEPLCRLRDTIGFGKSLPVTFAVYAERGAGIQSAQVRLQAAFGTVASITGITSAGWYTANTTIADVSANTKIDLQGRGLGVADRCDLYAAVLYTRAG
jgi:hypothetical protein